MSIAEKLQTIAENEQRVYEAGKKSQYDEFWDNYQKNPYNNIGERYDYSNAFSRYAWTDLIYKPKWDFGKTETINGKTVKRIENASNMFMQSGITDTLKPIDFSMNKYQHNSVFSYTTILKTIRTLTVVEGVTYNNWFQNATGIENITFEGVIGNDINFQWSTKLTKESITSIISHLSTTASGKTLTLSKTAVDNAYSDEGGIGEASNEWKTYIANYNNWTISLV